MLSIKRGGVRHAAHSLVLNLLRHHTFHGSV
jgi:hypothetical protein